MNFWDFFFYHGKPSIFFAVEIGAILSTGVLYFFFRKLRNKNVVIPVEKVRSIIPTIGLVLLIVALALSSFLDTGFTHMAGIISMVFGVTGLVWEKIHHKNSALDQIRTLDWDTTFFLVGVFILVGTITYTGWTNSFADYLSGFVGTNLLFAYILLIFISMLLSAFIDNVPFLAAMLPIALRMSTGLNIDPSLFLFGILIGASLGGNITPIGASANIVACGLLKKEGYQVSFKEFGRIGIPFTLVAVSAASIFVWFIWGP
jgi:Na+/H+ antiporter NhaD/arsenite permease-like protein